LQQRPRAIQGEVFQGNVVEKAEREISDPDYQVFAFFQHVLSRSSNVGKDARASAVLSLLEYRRKFRLRPGWRWVSAESRERTAGEQNSAPANPPIAKA